METASGRSGRSSDGKVALADQIENAYGRIGVTSAHKHILIMVLIGIWFDALEQNAVGLTGPVLQESWGLGGAEIGFLNTMTFTATALGRLLTGVIIDRFGRRKMLMINLLVFAGGSLICALAPNYAVLAAGRFIVGFGLGGEISVAVIMMAEFFAARHRGTAVGLINVTSAGLGNMLAPLFGILVFSVFDGPDKWRWLFGLLFLPCVLIMFFRRYVPETPRFLAASGRIEEANVVINRLARGQLSGPIDNPEQYLTGTGAQEPGKPPRSDWRGVLRGRLLRRTVLLTVAVCMSYAAQISMLTLMPTILVASGHDLTSSLSFTLLMQTGSLVGAIAAAFGASRLPRKKVLTGGAVLGCVAGLSIAVFSDSLPLVLAFGFLFNFSVIIVNTTIWLFAPELYPTRVRGMGTSIILAMGSLSGGLFPLVAGFVFDLSGLTGMFTMLAVLFVILGIAVQFPPETFGKPMEEDEQIAHA
ncbi:MFS transporter, putative metabolite:H+ symporter [Saccharopolyspora kobensis]|uniref:MFS transporter, putative metabolite:H+ symporter n=2 Tax=Saccharopolyspora kobensis TaxID=146035 RepID=A0A1H6CVT0_9PSEU|nr:MFS transporter [Saccharopolyspora kobensis]SEG77189.1 MFS transporter, putative metabolite:H+ symporter [Saccharopolyspora kobensis]SFD01504.1 MFS transporter, putative metabolite:H+ symporter [Saccharopolyspora kobensis]